jgi:hypothetical protein
MLRLSCSLQFGETFLDSKLKKFLTTGATGSQGEQGSQGFQGSRFKVEKIFHSFVLLNSHKLLICNYLCKQYGVTGSTGL